MEQEIRRKIEETEEIYRKNRVVLENHLDYLSNEQRKFQHYLENISVQINATAKHYETNPPENKRAVYRLLEQASEESRQRTRATQRNLEERLHENQSIYNKKIRQYEEEYRKSKREGESYV